MKRPPVPPVTHCRRCGSKLDIGEIRQQRTGGLFGNKQWQTTVFCPQCGYSDGFGWATFGFQQPSRNPFLRVLATLTAYLRRFSVQRRQHPRSGTAFGDRPGHGEIAKLVQAAPFPVYGLKGMPAGLRLRSPSYSGGGPRHPTLTGVEFLYVRGPAFEPEAGLRVIQGSRVGPLAKEQMFSVIEGMVRETATNEQLRTWFTQGDFHREWNLRRIEEATNFKVTAEAGGQTSEIDVQSWTDGRLFISRFELDEAPVLVSSVGLGWEEVLEAIRALTVLGEDDQAVAQHQQAFEAAMQELRLRHS